MRMKVRSIPVYVHSTKSLRGRWYVAEATLTTTDCYKFLTRRGRGCTGILPSAYTPTPTRSQTSKPSYRPTVQVHTPMPMFSGLAGLWSVGADGKTGINKLPNELLGAILELAVEPNYAFRSRCTPQEFPAHQLESTTFRPLYNLPLVPAHMSGAFAEDEAAGHDLSAFTLKQLRRVCKRWRAIADIYSCACYSTLQLQTNAPAHWRLRKLDFRWSYELIGYSATVDPYQSLENVLLGAKSLSYLTNVTISDRLQLGEWDSSAVALLFKHSANLPHVTSLVLEINEFQHAPMDGQLVWVSISSCFPQLLSLTVQIGSSKPLTGSVHLSDLESLILMTCHVTSEITWSLPNLRHLSAYCEDPSVYMGILETYRDRLTSILLYKWNPQLSITGQFWDNYPRLEVLGAPLKALRPLLSGASEPPRNHRFNHVCVMEDQDQDPFDPPSPRPHDKEYYENMLQAIPNWCNIRFLSLASLDAIDHTDEIHRRLESRGIRLLSPMGVECVHTRPGFPVSTLSTLTVGCLSMAAALVYMTALHTGL